MNASRNSTLQMKILKKQKYRRQINSDYFSPVYLKMDKVRLLPFKLMVETGHLPHCDLIPIHIEDLDDSSQKSKISWSVLIIPGRVVAL